jgi:predicted hydrocarbon binding protein
VRSTYPGSRVKVRLGRGKALIDLRGSLFCETREAAPMPLCGFYAAAIARVLHHFSLRADARVHECRAASRGKGCRLNVEIRGANADEPAAAA